MLITQQVTKTEAVCAEAYWEYADGAESLTDFRLCGIRTDFNII